MIPHLPANLQPVIINGLNMLNMERRIQLWTIPGWGDVYT